MVDISYLGSTARTCAACGAATGLRGASRLPFDGMNERGLAVAMAQRAGRALAGAASGPPARSA